MSMKHSMHQYNTVNMKFIKKPNLPESRVSLAAISCKAGESIKKLNELGINTLIIPSHPLLPEPVNSHADLQLLHFGGNVIFCQKEHLFEGELNNKFNLKIIKEKTYNVYPHDVRLNCAIIGNKIICNERTISEDILEYAYINDYKIINVNQGYSKCSVCIINENSILTDDESIFTAAGKFFDDAELISKGSIALKGYNYGFIGGCCGMIDRTKMAFNGEIETHKDYYKILDILSRNNIECIELAKGLLTDIGGILPLTAY